MIEIWLKNHLIKVTVIVTLSRGVHLVYFGIGT